MDRKRCLAERPPDTDPMHGYLEGVGSVGVTTVEGIMSVGGGEGRSEVGEC